MMGRTRDGPHLCHGGHWLVNRQDTVPSESLQSHVGDLVLIPAGQMDCLLPDFRAHCLG